MTIEKAIEILQSHVEWCDPEKEVETLDALKLGIEALKRINDWRHHKVTNPDMMLKGES